MMRQRAEEALSASVHHASLSQQYLTLSQKFAALAEQAASGHASGLVHSAQQLEREATTGIAANPIGVPQRPLDLPASVPLSRPHFPVNAGSVAASQDALDATVVHGQQIVRSGAGPSTASESAQLNRGAPFFSPPAKFSTPPDVSAGDPDQATIPRADVSVTSAGSTANPTTAKRPSGDQRKKSRRTRLSVKNLLDRARIVALEQAERVRLKVRRSDLKPQLRKTSEEIKEELKRSRVPAAMSTVVTLLALFMLALRHLEFTEVEELPPLVAGFSVEQEEIEESLPDEPPAEVVGEQMEQPTEEMIEEPQPEPEPEPMPEQPPEPMPEPEPLPEMKLEPEMAETSLPVTPNGTVPTNPDAPAANEMGAVDNRSDAGRKMLLEKFGGSAASESAVGNGLIWLSERQRSNGSWDFIDVGPCSHPGTVNNPIGGTAYALLPFLAAGQSHKEGPYKKQIQAGLEFLSTIGVAAPAGYDLRGVINKADDDEDPNYAYYVHGAATLALCEAYGMTKDRKLKPVAEGAVRFLINSQDPNGGGWRYNPQQPGSTSATAIQVMALKAAEKSGIKIPDATWKGVSFYLDSVQVDKEGRYGYEIQKKYYGVSVTSMALLSRMYLGWGRDDGDMRAGIALIDKRGPYDNLYYNYFATQVMKNWGGSEWDRWNGRLRDDLIAWQEKEVLVDGKNTNPARGSWTPRDRDDYSKAGGRLLSTALATLTLEVYYRYKPLLPETDANMSSAELQKLP